MQQQRTHIQPKTISIVEKKLIAEIFRFYLEHFAKVLTPGPDLEHPPVLLPEPRVLSLHKMHFATVRFADHASTSESTPSPEMSAKAAGHIYGVLTHLQGGLVLERLFSGDGTLYPVGEAVVQHLLHHLELEAAHRADVGLHIYHTRSRARSNEQGRWSSPLAAGGI